MRNIVNFLLVLLMIAACGSQTNDPIILNIQLDEAISGETINLLKATEQGLLIIDSAKLIDGKAHFLVSATQTDFYRLDLFSRKAINLILGKEDQEVSVITSIGGLKPVLIEGSRETLLIMSMDSTSLKRQSDTQLLNQEAIQARSAGDIATLNAIIQQFNYLNQRHENNLMELIKMAAPSLAGIYGMNYIDLENNFIFADSIASIYQEMLPGHILSRDLLSKVNALRSLSPGVEAPEIALPDVDGNVFALSSLKGKYVLIDFWAAWCGPCRKENPNVVKLYQKYRNENFEILGVSLDRTKQAWLKAIADDGLQWKHVSDLKYFNSAAADAYQITAIPQTFLIDPQGKILIKGLRGPTLEAKLKELFNY